MASAPEALHRRVVVAGAGVAAGYMAREFVTRGKGGELAVIGEEPVPPYERPALTKGVLFPSSPARLPGFHTCVGEGAERQDKAWYETNGIATLFGERVTAADLAARQLETSEGRKVTYDTLVVATGAAPAKLPESVGGNLNNVHYIRNNHDALELYGSLENGKQAGVIGGGYIGLETACALGAWQIPTRVAFPEPHIMPRLFPEEVAKKYEAFLQSKGVQTAPHSKLQTLVGDGNGNVKSMRLESGEEVECDLAIVGIGAKPNVSLFEGQIASEMGALKVDSRFRAEPAKGDIPKSSVYAVGDVAAFPLKMEGGQLTRNEHVKHARDSAKQATKDILGENPEEYDYLPFFYSRGFEHPGSERPLAWVFYGLQRGDPIVVGNFDPKMAAFWVEESRVKGVFLESGSQQQKDALPSIARSQPKVDAEKLRACSSVDDALALVGA